MGLEIKLEDERGHGLDSVEDPTNILHRILPSPENENVRYITRIDWYGDTTFNRPQCADVTEELRALEEQVRDEASKELLRRVIELAVRCQQGPHLYLKFYGD